MITEAKIQNILRRYEVGKLILSNLKKTGLENKKHKFIEHEAIVKKLQHEKHILYELT